MKVLLATESVLNEIDGWTNGINVLRFATDGSGNKVIGVEVLTDPRFTDILSQLELLVQVDYVQPGNITI